MEQREDNRGPISDERIADMMRRLLDLETVAMGQFREYDRRIALLERKLRWAVRRINQRRSP